jgi:hypothetical protein
MLDGGREGKVALELEKIAFALELVPDIGTEK